MGRCTSTCAFSLICLHIMVQSFERRKMQKAGVYYSFGGYKRISSLWMPFYGLLGFSFCFVIGSIRHENSVSQSGTESISSRGLRCHSWKRHLVLYGTKIRSVSRAQNQSHLGDCGVIPGKDIWFFHVSVSPGLQSAHHVPLYQYCSLR